MEENKMLDLMEAAERLEAVAASLEQAAERLNQQPVGPIVATVDETAAGSSLREQELERRLAEAETKLAQPSGRKTLAPGTATLRAKQGMAVEAGSVTLEAAALDGALASLSIEQRIAVKAELLRAGLLG
jgi:paraquat-inducible protein B